MNLSGTEMELGSENIISLFGRINTPDLKKEPVFAEEELVTVLEDEEIIPPQMRVSKVVNENQFPDQSIYVLEDQLKSLKSSLNRLKFYMRELDDILPC